MAKHNISTKDLKITFDGKCIYDPLPQQIKFHTSPAKYRLLGGSAGGGKTFAIIGEALMRSLKYDFPLTGAIFRRSFPELDSTIIRTMLEILPHWFYKYNQSQHVMTLKNGSVIEFCYAETDNDVIRYQSREWDWVGIDELTHFSLYQWTYLMSRLRTTKPINTKFFAGTNPGGRGHNWVRERWVTKTCDQENYRSEEYDFIPAGVLENPYIMENNPDYIENLKMLPEKERKALLEGDWNIFEGMFFTEFSPDRHVVDDFDVPEEWRLIMGWDDGTTAPRSVHVYAIDSDRRVWCIWEYYKEGENLKQSAENIRRKLKENGMWGRIYKLVVDPSMKKKDSQTGLSSIAVLEGMGFGFQVGEIELGNNNRIEGWRIMKSYLSHRPYEEPMLKFFRSCENMIRTIPQLVYYQPRSGGTSKKEDLDCFIAGTQVDTFKGRRNIEDINVGDLMRTPIGYREVIKDGISGMSPKTSWIELSNGERLEGTPDHKVFVKGKGLIELQSTSVGDILQAKNIYLWKPKRSNTMEYFIVGTLLAGIIARMEVILRRVTPRFIDRFISTILGLFQAVWQYTTKMVTLIITIFQTLNYSTTEYTASSIIRKEKIYKKNSRSGGNQRKVKKPLGKMQGKCVGEHQKYPVRAAIVERLLRQRRSRKNTVLRSVNINTGFLYKSPKLVLFVEKLLNRLIKRFKPVHINAVGGCENPKMVYNLTVDEAHLYYADGVLVTNTSQEDHGPDECRYVLMSLDRLPSRFDDTAFSEVAKRKYVPKSSY